MNEEVAYDTERKTKFQRIRRMVFLYSILTLFAIFVIIPFYWMILSSLKTPTQIESIPPMLWLSFSEMQFGNYYEAVFSPDSQPFLRYMFNTVVVAGLSTAGTIITTVLSAFAFARLNFKFKELFFLLLIMTMMIPGEMFVITNFITVNQLGWVRPDQTYMDAILAMSIPFMTSIFYIFFLRQTFKTIPDELYYAAKVDGTKDFKYLWKVMIPIARPTIITITILNAMGTWNAYIWPQLVTSTRNGRLYGYQLVSNGLRNAFSAEFQPQIHLQMAAAFMITLPLLITFFLLKKQIMRGVSRSGIKG